MSRLIRKEDVDELSSNPDAYKTQRNCNFCTHQAVCSAFANFKIHVEPMVFDQKSSLKADNLAWMCNLYEDKTKK